MTKNTSAHFDFCRFVAFYIFAIALGVSLTLLPGCGAIAFQPGTAMASSSPEQKLNLLRLATSSGATIGMLHKPASVPMVLDLRDQVSKFVTDGVEISPAAIAVFVQSTAVKYNVSAEDGTLYVNLALNIYRAFAGDLPQSVVISTDPAVKPYLQAFVGGLDDALRGFGVAPLASSSRASRAVSGAALLSYGRDPAARSTGELTFHVSGSASKGARSRSSSAGNKVAVPAEATMFTSKTGIALL